MSRWRVEEKRNINYRSLAPIISLLGVSHTRECQLWAAWAVANLTLFDEDKYCPLVEEEVTSHHTTRAFIEISRKFVVTVPWLQGGLAALQTIMEEILRESLTSPAPCPVSGRLLELGQRATHNILEWKKKKAKIEESGVDLIMVEVVKRD